MGEVVVNTLLYIMAENINNLLSEKIVKPRKAGTSPESKLLRTINYLFA